MTKKRWLGILVENEMGVLARISGLLAGKSYNVDSLTAGETEQEGVSRMTISLQSDNQTFEQIKKQLNRAVEVIKVIDYTEIITHKKELMFIKISGRDQWDRNEWSDIAAVFGVKPIDYGMDGILLESVQSEEKNNDLLRLVNERFPGHFEIVRGGSVAVEGFGLFVE